MTEIFSYRNVFHDGIHCLHPGFKHKGVLYVLTSTRPQELPYVQIPPDAIISEHLQRKKDLYLTLAYNQKAPRFNKKAGGKLDVDLVEGIQELFALNIIHHH